MYKIILFTFLISFNSFCSNILKKEETKKLTFKTLSNDIIKYTNDQRMKYDHQLMTPETNILEYISRMDSPEIANSFFYLLKWGANKKISNIESIENYFKVASFFEDPFDLLFEKAKKFDTDVKIKFDHDMKTEKKFETLIKYIKKLISMMEISKKITAGEMCYVIKNTFSYFLHKNCSIETVLNMLHSYDYLTSKELKT